MIILGNWNEVEMIVSLLGGIINKYLREYFEDIDSSQMGGSFFGGDLNLKNLKLRPSVFEKLGLPFRVIVGKCGKLEVQYSIFKLYSVPIVIRLKDLHVLACPSKLAHYDEAEEKLAQQHEKLRQLEEYEQVKGHLAETQQQLVANAPAQVTTYDAWVNSILRNINVKIESIHIRFEDDYTKKTEPFAAGITIEDLEVLSTDSKWKSQYMKDYVPETVYKLVKLGGLCVYWNPAPTHLYKNLKYDVLVEKLATIPKSGAEKNPSFKSLVGPISIEVKIQVTLCPDAMKDPFTKPKVRVDINLDQLLCEVSDKQVKDIFPYVETLTIFTNTLKFRKYRPQIRDNAYRGHYKQWWKFAYNCVMEDIERRRNNFRWKYISGHREKRWKYLKLYYKKTIKSITNAEIERNLTSLEEDLDLFNIILCRKHVEIVGNRERKDNPHNPGESEPGYVSAAVTWLWSWVPSWSSPPSPSTSPTPALPSSTPAPTTTTAAEQNKNSSKNTPPPKPTPEEEAKRFYAKELSRREKEDLKTAVAFAKNVYFVNYPPDYNDAEISVMLQLFRVKLIKFYKNQRQTVLDSLFHSVAFSFSTRPVNEGLLVEVKMGRLDAYGGDFSTSHHPSGRDDFFSSPQLLTTALIGMQEYLIKCSYEKSPVDSEVDHKISLEALGLQLIYNGDAIDNLIDFFTLPKQGEPKIIGTIPASKILKNILNFRHASSNRLLRIMENKGKIELNICLISPYVIIPQDTTSKTRSSFFVVELGEINLVGTIMGGTICEQGGCTYVL